MIELAGVKKGDVVYDLGSGDGKIVITAAKKGARSVGIDVDGESCETIAGQYSQSRRCRNSPKLNNKIS